MVTLDQLHEQLDRCGRKGRNGTAALRRVLGGLEPVEYRTDSLLEDKLIELLQRHRFPEPVRQWRLRINGVTVARPDLAWPRKNVVVEAYGYEFHSSRFDFVRDLRRHNLLTSLGLKVLYFTWDDLDEPGPFLDGLRAALESEPRSVSPVTARPERTNGANERTSLRTLPSGRVLTAPAF